MENEGQCHNDGGQDTNRDGLCTASGGLAAITSVGAVGAGRTGAAGRTRSS
jgi:hypothetical protein